MSEQSPAFKAEKQNVLGELSSKFNRIGSSDKLESLPPPPPVFQTYGTNRVDDDDLPPPPPSFFMEKQSCVSVPFPPPPPSTADFPSPPSIIPPDYSKLSPKKSDEDRYIQPKLQPISRVGLKSVSPEPMGPKGFNSSTEGLAYRPVKFNPGKINQANSGDVSRAELEAETQKPKSNQYENAFIGSSSVGYADSLVHNVAEKKLIPDRKLSMEKPLASFNETQVEDGVRRISILNRKQSDDRNSSTDRKPSPDFQSTDRKQSIDRKSSPDRKPSADFQYDRKQSTEWRPSPEQKRSLNNGFSIDRKSSQDTIVDLNFKEDRVDGRKESTSNLTSKTKISSAPEMDASSFSKDKCFKCGDLVDYGAILALNRAYHKGCFQCTDCGKVLKARFNSMKDSPYCDNCFEEKGERCSKCQGLIIGDSLKSGDKYFHTYCMKCSICEVELTGTYFTSGNNFICEKDYKASLEACSVCGTTLTGGFYKINDKPFCDKDYKKQLAACGICGGGVEGKLLKLGDQVFHPTCFNCTVCGINLAGVSFSQDEDQKVYCTKDFQRKYAAKCSGCGEPIVPGPGETTAERVRVQGSDFHPSCFKCQDCSLVFDSRKPGHECYPLDKLFLCKPCNIQRLNQL